MKSTIRLVAAMTLSSAMFSGYAAAADITGAGATFPYPLYAKWAETYKAKSGVGMNYQSIGSGGGIKQIQAKTVDFGASDKPLTLDELNKAGLTQFPAVMGGVVPVVNLPGVAPWISESRMAASRASTRKAKQRVISRNSGSRLVRGFCVELDS